jgi:Family of unknown function (DUF6499)
LSQRQFEVYGPELRYYFSASAMRAKQSYQIDFIHAQIPPQRKEVAWFKWEFLRRNPTYRLDHRKFVIGYGRWFRKRGYWYDYTTRLEKWTKSDEDHFYKYIAPKIYRLCRKWQIGNLFPPTWAFNRKTGVHTIRGRDCGLPTDLPAEMNWDAAYLKMLFEWRFSTFTTSSRRIGHLLAAEFDLNWPMKDLIEYAKSTLTYAHEIYRHELKNRGIKFRTGRRRTEDYRTHLQVWDLSIRGKRPAEISAILYPTQSLEEGVRRVRDHLRAAKRLIDGHYKEIR